MMEGYMQSWSHHEKIAMAVPPNWGTSSDVVSEEGHYVFVAKERGSVDKSVDFPSGRYVCQKLLGSGTYGKVVQCEDLKYNVPCAVKITRRGIQAYKDAATKEIGILRQLEGKKGTPKMLREFNHAGHLCIVFDLHGENLQNVLASRLYPTISHLLQTSPPPILGPDGSASCFAERRRSKPCQRLRCRPSRGSFSRPWSTCMGNLSYTRMSSQKTSLLPRRKAPSK